MLTVFFSGFFIGMAIVFAVWAIVEYRKAQRIAKELKKALEELEKTVEEAKK